MLILNPAPKRIRHLVPYEQVDPERQVALLERLPQVADLRPLFRCREDDEVEVGCGREVHFTRDPYTQAAVPGRCR